MSHTHAHTQAPPKHSPAPYGCRRIVQAVDELRKAEEALHGSGSKRTKPSGSGSGKAENGAEPSASEEATASNPIVQAAAERSPASERVELHDNLREMVGPKRWNGAVKEAGRTSGVEGKDVKLVDILRALKTKLTHPGATAQEMELWTAVRDRVAAFSSCKVASPLEETMDAGSSDAAPQQQRDAHSDVLFSSPGGQKLCVEDPTVEYDDELVSWMLDRETMTRPNTTYMKWHPSLNEKMRSILLDWLMEVCREFEMQRETFHLTVNIVDRFLSCVSEVHKNRLQLVGVAALFVASKVEEVYPPKANEFALITDGAFTIVEIYKMERLVLRKMDWDVISVTPCWWATYMVHRVHAAHQTQRYLNPLYAPHEQKPSADDANPNADAIMPANKSRNDKFGAVMGLIDTALLGYQSMTFLPSTIAAAACYLTLGLDKFLLEQTTGLEMSEVEPCIKWMTEYLPVLRQDQSHQCTSDNLYRNLTCEKDIHTIQVHDPDALNKMKEKIWNLPNTEHKATNFDAVA